MEKMASIFKALSEEIRLKMLAMLLWEKELCVCDIERVLGIRQSKASRHLQYMRHAGIVKTRREGIWMFYSLSENLSPDLKILVKTLKAMFSDKAYEGLRADLKRYLALKGNIKDRCPADEVQGTR